MRMAVIAASVALLFAAQILEASSMDIKIGDGKGWSFFGGQWTESTEGVIAPPDVRNLHSRAFYTAKAFSDARIEFDYNPDYRETGHGIAGLILRAKDANQYSINVSWDNGINWDEGAIIDYPVWAMGNIVEVEPNVLLCT